MSELAAYGQPGAIIRRPLDLGQLLIGLTASRRGVLAGEALVSPLSVPMAVAVHVPNTCRPGSPFEALPGADVALPFRHKAAVLYGRVQLLQQPPLARVCYGDHSGPAAFAPARLQGQGAPLIGRRRAQLEAFFQAQAKGHLQPHRELRSLIQGCPNLWRRRVSFLALPGGFLFYAKLCIVAGQHARLAHLLAPPADPGHAVLERPGREASRSPALDQGRDVLGLKRAGTIEAIAQPAQFSGHQLQTPVALCPRCMAPLARSEREGFQIIGEGVHSLRLSLFTFYLLPFAVG